MTTSTTPSTRTAEAASRREAAVGAARKGAIYGIIVSFSLAALVGIVALLSGDFGETQVRIVLTTLLLGATSITALCHLAIADRAMRIVGFVGLAASAITLITGLVLIWREWNDESFEDWLKPFATAGIIAVSFAHANLLLLLAGRRRAVIRYGLMITLVMIVSVAIMIILPILSEGEIPGVENEEWYWRLFGVVGILDVLGTVVVPVLAIFVRDAPAVATADALGASAATASLTHVELTLPADLAESLAHRAAADGVPAGEAAIAAMRRGLHEPADR